MKKIQLGGHYKNSKIKGYAIIDDDDFEYLNQWNWQYDPDGYAVRSQNVGYKKVTHIKMHRIINNTPKGFITDHINRNGLDNRKNNLRTVDKSQNTINSGIWKSNTSGVKGISWSKRRKRWRTYITLNYKTVFLGEFKNKEDAAIARKKAESIYHTKNGKLIYDATI